MTIRTLLHMWFHLGIDLFFLPSNFFNEAFSCLLPFFCFVWDDTQFLSLFFFYTILLLQQRYMLYPKVSFLIHIHKMVCSISENTKIHYSQKLQPTDKSSNIWQTEYLFSLQLRTLKIRYIFGYSLPSREVLYASKLWQLPNSFSSDRSNYFPVIWQFSSRTWFPVLLSVLISLQ